jgi:hypothetical protein
MPNLLSLILIFIINIKSTNPINPQHLDINIDIWFFIKSSLLFYAGFFGLPTLFCFVLKKKYKFDNFFIKILIYIFAAILFSLSFFVFMGSDCYVKYFYFSRQLSYVYYENLASISAAFKFISFGLVSLLIMLAHSLIDYLREKKGQIYRK